MLAKIGGMMSLATALSVLGLALIDTLSPAVIGIVLYLLLAQPRRVGLLLASYLTTVASAYFLLGALLMVGLGAIMPTIKPAVGAGIQAGIGITLFIASWFIPAKPRQTPRRPKNLTIPAMITFGLGTWLFEFATAVPYFTAIGIMTAAHLSLPQWLPLLIVYVAIMILPGLVLYLAWLALGERTRERFERWRTKMNSNVGGTVSWIIGIAGVLIFFNALPVLIV
ncbi:MAG: GAP family protein [Propionibacteriaceae bacterium]|nr:GAP family protein [Propionibacteriaceae bacterium]